MALVSKEVNDQSNMLTLMLVINFRWHIRLTEKARAIKISKACKIIRDCSFDRELRDTCRIIIKAVQRRDYEKVINLAARLEVDFCAEQCI